MVKEEERVSRKGYESMDFDENESVVWRKHHLRNFFREKGTYWTSSRTTTAYKWGLVIVVGIVVGFLGAIVTVLTQVLSDAKFNVATAFLDRTEYSKSFFSFLFISISYALIASLLCCYEPEAVGSGIPEIKAFLNGVNIMKSVQPSVLLTKLVGVCFSVAAGLPLGKEGPMIHVGAIAGAVISQGETAVMGYDTSWAKYQNLRNDHSKRDFVTFGAAAGVAAAFKAPIGGILFTLEEGASFWSSSVTFRSFVCAMVTMLIITFAFYFYNEDDLYVFGPFSNYKNDRPNWQSYELIFFALMGCIGGMLGSINNSIAEKMATVRRNRNVNTLGKRLVEVLLLTAVFAMISFVLPSIWTTCTPIPTDTADWTAAERDLLNDLVSFKCNSKEYNELASLYFVPAETAMWQLFHYKEYDGTPYITFGTAPLLLFFIPYFLIAAVTIGILVPAGLFIPNILSGAAFGRIVGHLMNSSFPGYVADSGTYAFVGSAAMLGGMSRMTIAGTVILLEACGNANFLLPLMVTFATARYTGNAINMSLYDLLLQIKKLPFLEGTLPTIGLLNIHPVLEIMSSPVVTFREVDQVGRIYNLLLRTNHNGFPIVNEQGQLLGLILRKTLCSLLKYRVFCDGTVSISSGAVGSVSDTEDETIQISAPAPVFYETLERHYPHFPTIDNVDLSDSDMSRWLDLRPYMDRAPFTIGKNASVSRCYRLFRTMGLRHLVVLKSDHVVVGIVTRANLLKHELQMHEYGDENYLQKSTQVDGDARIKKGEFEKQPDAGFIPPTFKGVKSGSQQSEEPLLSRDDYSQTALSTVTTDPEGTGTSRGIQPLSTEATPSSTMSSSTSVSSSRFRTREPKSRATDW